MRCATILAAKYFVILSLIFCFQLPPVSGSDAWAAKPKRNQPPSMSFILVRSADCLADCAEWVSAEGRITRDTPLRLKKILKQLNGRKLPVVFRSEGGEVDAAYAMGRMIRKNGLETAVGGTRLKDCPIADMRCKAAIAKDGTAAGLTYSGGAYCLSACPIALAGGMSRVASQWAYIGVHQITTIYDRIRVSYRIEYRMVNGRKEEISRTEIGRRSEGETKSTKLGKKAEAALSAYLKEMGVSQDIIALMMSATPQTLRLLPTSEALKLGLITDMLASNESPGIRLCQADDPAGARCHRHGEPPATTGAPADVQPASAPAASGG